MSPSAPTSHAPRERTGAERPLRIAVIGAGISGLCAAYGLGRRHEVTLFEAGDYLGGHTNTVDVEHEGERQAIDTGFIVFNDRTYPNFVALLEELGVASRPTSMSFSVRCERSGWEYNGSSLPGLFAQRRNLLRPRFWRMLRDIVRFNRQARACVLQGPAADPAHAVTVGDFVRDGRYSSEFTERYLLPMGSAIWSCPTGTFSSFSMAMMAEFFHHHGLLDLRNRPQWRVVAGGSRRYVQAIVSRLKARVCVGTPIERVRRDPQQVELTPRGGAPQVFDHVVLACHADQALRMLADPSPVERDLLGAFPFERNVAVLHTDTAVLPRRRRAWASWNYYVPRQASDRATVTYCMNILQHLPSRHTYCVTLNREDDIDPRKVLRRFVYHHPVFTAARAAARQRHTEVIDVNRTSYCGAYWGNGFHEDGVVSAWAVCRALNAPAQQRPLAGQQHASPRWVAQATT